jgi:hypothetical protein
MSSDTSKVASATYINNSSEKNSKEQPSITQGYKDSCQECLSSSLSTQTGKTRLNIDEAIQKIELVKEAIPENLKDKLHKLMTELKTANPEELNNKEKIKLLLNKTFQDQTQVQNNIQAQASQAALHTSDKKNPFKTENPFAPKPIKKIKKTNKSSLQKEQEKTILNEEKNQELTKKEKKSILSRILGLFK